MAKTYTRTLLEKTEANIIEVIDSKGGWSFGDLQPENRLGYAFEYFVAPEKVDVEPKPHDCEFMNAPVGDKSCHFDKEVDVVRNERGEVTNVIVTWNKVQE